MARSLLTGFQQLSRYPPSTFPETWHFEGLAMASLRCTSLCSPPDTPATSMIPPTKLQPKRNQVHASCYHVLSPSCRPTLPELSSNSVLTALLPPSQISREVPTGYSRVLPPAPSKARVNSSRRYSLARRREPDSRYPSEPVMRPHTGSHDGFLPGLHCHHGSLVRLSGPLPL